MVKTIPLATAICFFHIEVFAFYDVGINGCAIGFPGLCKLIFKLGKVLYVLFGEYGGVHQRIGMLHHFLFLLIVGFRYDIAFSLVAITLLYDEELLFGVAKTTHRAVLNGEGITRLQLC
jgi:hypothetical protein